MFDCGGCWIDADVADVLECRLDFEDLIAAEADYGLQRGSDGAWEALAA